MLALLPLTPLRHCQHRKLTSVQPRSSCDTRWHHCQHRAIVVASVALALLPLPRGRHCPCCAGVAILGTPALLPASQAGICPVMMQSQHIVGEALLSCSTSLPMASLLYPASADSNLAFNGLAKAAMAFFLVLRWCPCLHCTGIIASVRLSLLPALHRHCCRVGLRRSGRCRAGICQRCACILPALCWRHCQHRAVVLVAGIATASLPSLHGHFCPGRAGIVALIAFALPPASQTGVCPVMKQS